MSDRRHGGPGKVPLGARSAYSQAKNAQRACRIEPRQVQAVGPGTMTRPRGTCAGIGWRAGLLRVKARTRVVSLFVAAALSGASRTRYPLLTLQPRRIAQAGE